MNQMQYEAPGSVEDTVALLSKANGAARILAGGTDLLAQMKTGLVRPELVVDVKKIPELTKIAREGGGFRMVCGIGVPGR